MIPPRAKSALLLSIAAVVCLLQATAAAADSAFPAAQPLFKQFCFDCHDSATAESQVNLEQLTANPAFNARFKTWEKVAAMLETGRMPPKDMPQPSAEQRRQFATIVRDALRRAADDNAGDPGHVVLRRLTSAEYAYTIQDLTGLDLDLEREFVSDAAGGEGFTNVGTVQFLDDAGLERYLEAAKKVAAHAVIGSGPLQFFSDPGKTGLELSAINRVRQVYRDHGFRTAAGEGGKPFGLNRYPKAFFAAWRYDHRRELGLGEVSLARLAADEGLAAAFVEHVHSVLSRSSHSFPTSEIVARWQQLPVPTPSDHKLLEAKAACDDLYTFMSDWQTRLAKAVGDEEEAPVLSENSFLVEKSHAFTARFPWMEPPAKTHVQFSVVSADPSRKIEGIVVWRNPRLRWRRFTRRREEPLPFTDFLSAEQAAPFAFGQHPRGGEVAVQDFVTFGAETRSIELAVPEGARGLEVHVDVKLDLASGEDCVVRCTITEDGEAGKPKAIAALLADPDGQPFQKWKTGVIEFARLLPQISHREPAPSDRDPIPFPFENTYNTPERNFFHTGVKYHRDDRFFTQYLIDDATRQRLDEAWTDLLTSFEYYDILLRFTFDKYKVDLAGRGVASLDDETISRLPSEPRQYITRLRDEYAQAQQRLKSAQSRHLQDALDLASRAWRRPLAEAEKKQLLAFYERLRQPSGLDHADAMRSLLARILVAPQFVYRAERAADKTDVIALSDWELANRLSYLLWSSLPDEELRRAAAAGELRDPANVAIQARRMLHDPKARRLATEFFGQWLGFYQFDRYRGIDPEKFPEFNDRLKTSLYDEAVSFFEHIVREDRPMSELLFADYTFLNEDLAKHYAINAPAASATPARVENISGQHRGGLLSLGAVLTVTSAPLRTSPVKRGDWILRRVLGTPVPPPPANAGSIAADESPADGKTVRQRLEAHRRDASCVNCHSRIDPLGFALEHFDPLGRWRETYRNDEPIDDALTVEGGASVAGIEGLRHYMRDHQDLFYQTLCTKLLAYSLGRGELASDRQLMTQMLDHVKSGEAPLADLLVDIVTSKQFRYRRSQSLQSTTQPQTETSHANR